MQECNETSYVIRFGVIDRKMERSMSVAEMVTVRWKSGVTREDRIRNGYVTSSVCVASTEDKMRKNRLR